MTTDRDLIALAAQAMGRTVTDTIGGGGTPEVYRLDDGSFFQPLHVNPMTDCMGDALRLAVNLHIGVRSNSPSHWQNADTTIAIWDDHEGVPRQLRVGHDEMDAAAATRRAITRAAAEIARATAAQRG